MGAQRRRKPHSAAAMGLAVSLVAAGLSVAAATNAQAATQLTLSVDASAARHAISPDVYGMNGADPTLAAEIGMPVARWGGNSSSRYNFKNHTYNTGSDWYFENIVAGADKTVEAMVKSNLDRGIRPVVTVPMVGWVSKDSPSDHPFNCGFPKTRFPEQDSFDQWDANCGNGKLNDTNLTGSVPEDTSIPADESFDGEMVSHLVSQFGTAAKGGVPIYELDNEPVLWNSTHRDVHPDPVSYDEMGGKGTKTAAVIKAADPSAAVLGPSGWGYCEWVASGVDGCAPGTDAAAHGGLKLAPWYLKNMKDYSDAHGGKRYLDYFDEHYYPQISGGTDADSNALRLRSTRSLWDPTYVEESWIGPSGVNAPPLQFIRQMKSWVDQYYPGTKTSITEYNWGALDTMNGALAEADVLGIFGREGLDLATIWGDPKPTDPAAYSFRMYRNYDGAGGRFGDVSVSAASTDQDQLAVYGAQRTADGALTLMVLNKTGGDLTAPLSVAGFDSTGTAQRYSYGPANLASIVHGADVPVNAGAVNATYPANSITLLVLPKGTGGPSPTPTASSPSPSPSSPSPSPSSPSPTPTSPSPTPTPAGGCSATLHVDSDWHSGFTATVTVTNKGSSATKGWRVNWSWPGGQQISNSWNATVTQTGANVSATNASWNGSIPKGGNTTFGFLASSAGATPTLTCTAT
ncbi:glycoside hydrolase family 44 protein [Plantactinospora siamensis]|uniref:Glycoside hydrolase family 44 protein n=1 Tax=Plantactinospora siamensis TaxID=555372 RepID=A0ABV6NZ60_9ACTN